ncbi:hypothetical protein GCM10017673_57560 [Streptosporangium violaceochromogenes]|nr:hypothetical protein GCM10017673_57560 [Streptosporangium violaceochromogenes]
MLEDLSLDEPPEPLAEYKTVAAIFGASFCHGRLITLAGAPWVGKSSLLMTMLRYFAVIRQQPAVFVSTEYPEDAVRDRLLAGLAGVSVHRVRRWDLSVREHNLLDGAKEQLAAAPGLRLVCSETISLDTLKDQVEKEVGRGKLPALFVDNLQMLIDSERWSNVGRDHDEDVCGRDCPVDHVADDVLRELRLLAMRADIPIVVTSSLAGGSRERRPGRLDVTDEVEQWSDILLLLHRESQRSSEPGVQVCGKIDFSLDWSSTLRLQGYLARAINLV